MPAPEKLIWQFNVDASEREFTYTPDGATVSDGQRTYTWDAANRMTSVTVGSETYSWEYDGAGRRKIEKLNGNTTKRWVWNGLSIIQERDPSNAVARGFYGAGIKAGTDAVVLARDHLGSVRDAIGSNGDVRSRYQYDLWGGRLTIGTPAFDVPLGFTGHLQHSASGLVLAPYRSYSPLSGRWLSRDPVGEAGDLVLYRYTYNDPINYVDPDGEFGKLVVGAVVVVGAVAAFYPIASATHKMAEENKARATELLNMNRAAAKQGKAGQAQEFDDAFNRHREANKRYGQAAEKLQDEAACGVASGLTPPVGKAPYDAIKEILLWLTLGSDTGESETNDSK